jgi:tyrosinase
VFWLHHANLDRLWQVWLDADPAHVQPTGDPAWADTTFSFPRVGGGRVSWRVGDVLELPALGYSYESLAPPSALVPPAPAEGGAAGIESREVRMSPSLPPQTLGAALDVAIGAVDPVEVDLVEPVDRRVTADAPTAGGGQVFLRIEGITGTAAAAAYHVYVNVPAGAAAGDHPELRAGTISTFGVAEASQRSALHDGTGLTKVLDITPVRDTLLAQGRWDPGRVTVSFRPVVPRGAERSGGRPVDLRAGQVTVLAT